MSTLTQLQAQAENDAMRAGDLRNVACIATEYLRPTLERIETEAEAESLRTLMAEIESLEGQCRFIKGLIQEAMHAERRSRMSARAAEKYPDRMYACFLNARLG